MGLQNSLSRFFSLFHKRSSTTQLDGKIAAAHYFGEHSPIGFWIDQDIRVVPQHFETLKTDGFSAIILVIPWPLFQATIVSESLDGWYVDRLQAVLTLARKAGLRVILRVGFIHHPSWTHNEDVLVRPLGVFGEPNVRTAFVRMIKELQAVVAQFDHVDEVFMSWEELWPAMDLWAHLDEPGRLASAKQVNFPAFLERKYALHDISKLYGRSFDSFEEVPIPERLTSPMRLLIEFFDDAFKSLLKAGQAVMPRLSVEIRPDGMPIRREGGGYDWVYHDVMSDDFPRRATYWGPFFGASNQANDIEADEAIRSLNYLLAIADPLAHGDLLLEQFNFVENTFIASHHSRIAEASIDHFLDRAAVIIREKTRGYGIWATRDYRENFFSNATFQRALENWSVRGSVVFMPSQCVLNPRASIEQSFIPAMKAHSPQSAYSEFVIEIFVSDDGNSIDLNQVRLILNGNALTSTHMMHESFGLRATFPVTLLHWNSGANIMIENCSDQTLRVTRCYAFGFVQSLGVYDRFGQPSVNAARIRKLNQAIGARA
jgi:hypothetical protein